MAFKAMPRGNGGGGAEANPVCSPDKANRPKMESTSSRFWYSAGICEAADVVDRSESSCMGPLPQPRMGGASGGDDADERLGGNIAAWVLSHGERRRGGGFSVVMVDASRMAAAAAVVTFAVVVRVAVLL
jgi:hypothetical protein